MSYSSPKQIVCPKCGLVLGTYVGHRVFIEGAIVGVILNTKVSVECSRCNYVKICHRHEGKR